MIDIRTAVETDLQAILGLYSQEDFDNGAVLDIAQAENMAAICNLPELQIVGG
ncbi:MAG: hypothetical protein R3E50_12690 [Halioglobus sp.]